MSRNHGAVSCVATRFEHCGRILFFMCASTVVDELLYLSSLSASFFFFFFPFVVVVISNVVHLPCMQWILTKLSRIMGKMPFDVYSAILFWCFS